MNRLILFILLVGVYSQGCNHKKVNEFDQKLADELKSMTVTDQIAAGGQQGEYKNWTNQKWNNFTDSVFTTHKRRLEQIFGEFGFPGFNLVGKEGSNNFWLMTQHSDSDVDFQSKILEEMKIEVDNKNADPANYAYLTDRVRINSGQKQIYGTQVTYTNEGRAYPKPLLDSVKVNEKRKTVGLEPIEQYLNMMTLLNFEMNKELLKAKGITEPKLYPTSDSIVFKFEK